MKWSSFLLGSFAGVALSVYAAKKRPGMFAWASSAAGEVWGGMKGKAVDAVINRNIGSDRGHKASKHAKPTQEKTGENWVQIEELLNQEPRAKQQVEEIMEEAAKH
ncbi:hypothetical protein [Paenibacillus nasutitermitis]|uniref:YtxH domain-containing protein n=1 Tax=Paenibacillus nasutitermitis TaxID=1652958 RepID=A0A916Z042_9BACL|nr:hypothetical protein [Paenibacillus nasutitermitis]GGD69412.1 hypothetical protein GCM10010911_29140 [Paenibacillus nasutitermitis]